MRVTASSRGSSLSPLRSLYVFLISLHSVCSVPFSSSAARPVSPLAFTYVRPIQMAKVNFTITKYLARKSLRYGATHHFGGCRHHPRERNSPWTFMERKGPPTPVSERTSRPREGHPELTSPNQLALAINICENNVSQMKFNNGQTDYSRAPRPRIWSTGCKN